MRQRLCQCECHVCADVSVACTPARAQPEYRVYASDSITVQASVYASDSPSVSDSSSDSLSMSSSIYSSVCSSVNASISDCGCDCGRGRGQETLARLKKRGNLHGRRGREARVG